MKVVGIVGYKNSGKTTLALKIAKQLSSRGYRVAAIKHVSEEIEQDDTDSGKYRSLLGQVVLAHPKKTVIFLQDTKNIEQVINFLDADIIIVEGFKNESTFPKIVCLREPWEKEKLLNGL